VTLTPLASRTEAEASIINTQAVIQQRTASSHDLDESDSDGDEEEFSAAVSEDVDDEDVQRPSADTSSISSGHQRTSSVAEDVMKRKGSYGRFAQKWFSRKGWAVDQRRNLGMAVSDSGISTPDGNESAKVETPNQHVTSSDSDKNNDTSIRDQKVSDVAANLLPKLLRTTQILFGSSQSFFFSYDFDITRSLINRRTTTDLPLHTQVDPTFFWNRHIIQPFIDAGQISLVLPLMQGFVGQRSFEMDPDPPKPVIGLDGDVKSSMELVDMSTGRSHLETTEGSDSSISSGTSRSTKSFLLTLISRRSVHRAGLRYLRRGIDEDGHTANTVETEQVLSDTSWTPSSKIYSFVQIRGSVPIFFSQSPYSFKPVPQLQHSEEMNYGAFVKHFTQLSDMYGTIQIASLVEKHGNEAIVGESYEKCLNKYNKTKHNEDSPVGFEWFDFHAVCRGMRFENVSSLFEEIGKTLDNFGDTVQVDGKLLRKQTGVLRTNCMDCLDRTNVTQSACGRRALESQLKSEGIDMSLQADQTTQWFNTLWADNGDSISKQYASTAAMKGDFTRTRKRDFQGALKDIGISISRFYSGYVLRRFKDVTDVHAADDIERAFTGPTT
jgi:SacI homology domain